MIKLDRKKVTWNDLHEAGASELKRKYRLNDRELDKQIRHHMDGSNHGERRKMYDSIYRRK